MKKIIIFLLVISAGFALGLYSTHYRKFPGRIFGSSSRSLKGSEIPESDKSRAEAQQSKAVRSKRLASLPYLSGYQRAPQRSGVVKYDPALVEPGLNLSVSGHAPEAILMDMNGKARHKWKYEYDRVWPDRSLYLNNGNEQPKFWRRVHLFPNGDLLAIFDYIGLIKIDSDSKLLWSYKGGCHHDLAINEAGNIYVLTYKQKIIPELNRTVPVMEDFITVLSPEGKFISEISLLEVVAKSPFSYLIPAINDNTINEYIDIFHTNTIEVFNGRLAGKSPLFAKGNILVSFCYLSAIAIIDPGAENVVWLWGPNNLLLQHQPTLLPNGNIMIFSNYSVLEEGQKSDSSTIIELDPLTMQIIWRYQGTSENPFFSKACGSNQRLLNGNTLITESTAGRAFEVTRDKQIVWEFLNPYRAEGKKKLIATLFEMERIDPKMLSKTSFQFGTDQ